MAWDATSFSANAKATTYLFKRDLVDGRPRLTPLPYCVVSYNQSVPGTGDTFVEPVNATLAGEPPVTEDSRPGASIEVFDGAEPWSEVTRFASRTV